VSHYKKLEKILLENHPYEVPEIICLPITQGSRSYLSWISGETKKV
jgi:periplasmic divalent cation tolerance protein